jgi:hypothetical protein
MNNLRAHLSKLQKPPAGLREAKKSKARKAFQGWQDVSMTEHMPNYNIAEDKFASGYLAGLKRHGHLKPFLNLVYDKHLPEYVRPTKLRGASTKPPN